MTRGHEYYPLSLFVSAASSGVGMVIGLFTCCWLGVVVVVLCLGAEFLGIFADPWFIPLWWFVAMIMGLFQGWGLISYVLIAACGAYIFTTDGPRRHGYLAAFVIQTVESARLVCTTGTVTHLPAVAIVLVVVIAAYVGVEVWVRRYWRHSYERLASGEKPCRACGYDLRGTIAARRLTCPECGEPIVPGVTGEQR